MSSDEEWVQSANDALEVSLVVPGVAGTKTIAKFHPQFTYPVFGDDEQIFGYRDLRISLAFNATDMRPNLNISYSKKFKTVGETEAVDIEGILREFLPEVAFQKKNEFEAAAGQVPSDWSPPGTRVETIEVKQGSYEVWKGSLEDSAIKQIIKRIQIFVPFFIEGGRYIGVDEADDDRWTIFFLYQKQTLPGQDTPSYVFAGYSTVYRFFLLDKTKSLTTPSSEIELNGSFDLMDLPCRTRISQFLVLPPFQGKGVGPAFYSTLFNEYQRHPQTVEITVEDPNEAFDDLRDVTDLKFLQRLPEFNAITLNKSLTLSNEGTAPNNIVDRAACEALRQRVKIAPRQFYRVLEMHLMSKLPEPVRPGFSVEKPLVKANKAQNHELALWRLLVKMRVYRHNKDALGQLEVGERIQKLHETVLSVEFDYARLLAKAAASTRNELVSNGKRKLGSSGLDESSNSSKKARVEDAA